MDAYDRLRTWLTWVLAVALVVSVVGVVYVAVNPPETTDPYTEFYILGPEGNASGYPTTLGPGEAGEVIVGVSNHEHRTVAYWVEITWNGTTSQTLEFSVEDDRTVERRVQLTAPSVPDRYRVRFLLYMDEQPGEPSHSLRLWVTVRE